MDRFNFDFVGGALGMVIVAISLVALTIYSYKKCELPRYAKIILMVLRSMFFVGIILVLANFRIDSESFLEGKKSKKVALIFDTSESMLIADFWNKTRLNSALDFAQKHLQLPENNSYSYFELNEKATLVKSVNELKNVGRGHSTNFVNSLESLQERLKDFDYAILFTDGIDSSRHTNEEIIGSFARYANLKFFVIPFSNRLAATGEVFISKLDSVSQANVNSEREDGVYITTLNRLSKEELFVELYNKDSGKLLQRIPVPKQRGTFRVPFKVVENHSGISRYMLKLTPSKCAPLSWSVNVTERGAKRKFLLYNGALEFGTRFLRRALKDNPHAELEVNYAPGVFPTGLQRGEALEKYGDFKSYDTLILMNVKRDSISNVAAENIKKFVYGGGGLLFITANPNNSSEFASTELEQLLPVTFNPIKPDSREDSEVANLIKILDQRAEFTSTDSRIVRSREFKLKVPKLNSFEVTTMGKHTPIFSNVAKIQWQDSASVQRVKAGATVLATSGSAEREPLLVVQNYGAGRSSILASDPLWRWKLQLDHKAKDFDVFWNNLLNYLSAGRRVGRFFTAMDMAPQLYQEAVFYLENPQKDDVSATLITQDDLPKELPIVQQYGRGVIKFIPELEGQYRLTVGRNKELCEVEFTVRGNQKKGETTELIVDVNRLKSWEQSGNLKVLNEGEDFDLASQFNQNNSSTKIVSTKRLWQTKIIFWLLLGIFLVELIFRRFYRMV